MAGVLGAHWASQLRGGRDELKGPDKAGQEDQRQRGDKHHLGRQITAGEQGAEHDPEPGGGQQERQGKEPEFAGYSGAGNTVVIEAEAEEVGHRKDEKSPTTRGAGQQQGRHGGMLPVA